jgi:uncharacterized iron-regulated membrane protein
MLNFILFCCIVLIVVTIYFWFRAWNHGLWRRILYKTHLWLGLMSGLVLFIICLSGTILVFQEEIHHFVESDKYYVKIPENEHKFPIDEIIQQLETRHTGMKVVFVSIPEETTRTMRIVLLSAGTEIHLWISCEVNPYTGDSTVEETPDKNLPISQFIQLMAGLHTHLLLPYKIKFFSTEIVVGRLIVGVSTMIFVIIALSGFVIWLPRTWKAWKTSFRIRIWNGLGAFIHDFHRVVGIFVLIPILLCALTGLRWSFSWYRDGVNYLLGAKLINNTKTIEPVDDSMQPFPVGEIIDRANKLLPKQGDMLVSLPRNKENGIEIRKSGNYMLWDPFHGTLIPVKDYNGKMVEIERFADRPSGAKIADWFPAIHYGNIAGTSSKIIFFFACLFATTLPVTGAVIWARKLYLKRRSRRKKS